MKWELGHQIGIYRESSCLWAMGKAGTGSFLPSGQSGNIAGCGRRQGSYSFFIHSFIQYSAIYEMLGETAENELGRVPAHGAYTPLVT